MRCIVSMFVLCIAITPLVWAMDFLSDSSDSGSDSDEIVEPARKRARVEESKGDDDWEQQVARNKERFACIRAAQLMQNDSNQHEVPRRRKRRNRNLSKFCKSCQSFAPLSRIFLLECGHIMCRRCEQSNFFEHHHNTHKNPSLGISDAEFFEQHPLAGIAGCRACVPRCHECYKVQERYVNIHKPCDYTFGYNPTPDRVMHALRWEENKEILRNVCLMREKAERESGT